MGENGRRDKIRPYLCAQTANGFIVSLAVKEAIAEMADTQDISQPIILRKLLHKHPEIEPKIEKDQIKAQIAGTLSRLYKAGKLLRVKASHGSEPGIYKKNIVAEMAAGST